MARLRLALVAAAIASGPFGAAGGGVDGARQGGPLGYRRLPMSEPVPHPSPGGACVGAEAHH